MCQSGTSEHFLGLDEKYRDPNTSRFVVLPIRYDDTASFLKGSAEGPKAIIAASAQLEPFDELLLGGFYECGIYTANAIESRGFGPEQMQEKIYEKARDNIKSGKILISLGGEHSITVAIVKAFAEKYPNLSILQIDAHADLRDEYEGSRFSHACVMRRIFEMHIPAVGVGIRSFDRAQHDFMVKNKLKIFSPTAIAHKKDWIADIITSLSKNVYISLDIDGMDPSEAPGTGTPEPGGLKYQQVVDLILAVGRKKNIVGADVVEVIPRTAGVITEYLAARLVYKIIVAAQLEK